MSRDPLGAISPRKGTPQRVQARADQIQNNAGGFVFGVSELIRLDRFLMLGTDGGTFYVTEKAHTKENAEFIIQLAQSNIGIDMVHRIEEISLQGRAPRQNPILFALAVATAYGNDETRYAAFNAVPKVVRTGSHLFQFITYREQLAGWGRGMRWAVGQAWYNLKDADKLAYQMVKYRTRNEWSHRDALRLSHPKSRDDEHQSLYRWAVGKSSDSFQEDLPGIIQTFEFLQKATSVDEIVSLIGYDGTVSWEMIPDRFMNESRVWKALFNSGIPQTALIRQLPRLTRMGMFDPFSNEFTSEVANQIVDENLLKRGRVHPIQVLIAQKTYTSGQGTRSTWTPNTTISNALDAAFYRAFKTVEPTGKRIMLAVDVSGSMDQPIPGRNPREPLPLTVRDAAAALTLVTLATEPNAAAFSFSDGTKGYGNWRHRDLITPLNISPRQRLDDVIRHMASLSFGGTDLVLPMQYALNHNLNVDAFVIYTDNETWFGSVHPYQALKTYRQRINPNAKLVVVGMTSTGFSIADPLDLNTLDVVGFDASVPSLIADFIRG